MEHLTKTGVFVLSVVKRDADVDGVKIAAKQAQTPLVVIGARNPCDILLKLVDLVHVISRKAWPFEDAKLLILDIGTRHPLEWVDFFAGDHKVSGEGFDGELPLHPDYFVRGLQKCAPSGAGNA